MVRRFYSISASVRIQRSTLGLRVLSKVHFDAELWCSRCLETFRRDFDIELPLTYVAGEDPFKNQEKVDLKKTDIEKVYYSGSSIDLAIGIKEAIILAIPVKILCQPECAGLCPCCGRNLNKFSCDCKASKEGPFTVSKQSRFKKEKQK